MCQIARKSGILYNFMNRQLVYVGVISKDDRPIILRDFRQHRDISLDLVLYSSLDIIDRKVQEMKENTDYNTNYLGYLGPALLGEGDYALYGWLSYTGAKFVSILKENYDQRNEEKIKGFLREVEKLYYKTYSNPFFSEQDFHGSAFISKIQNLSNKLV